MRSLMAAVVALSLSLSLAPLAAHADEPTFAHEESPYQLRLDVDIAAVVLGGVLWGGSSLIGNGQPGAYCGTSTTPACNAHTLNALDRLALGRSSPGARIAADVLSVVPVAYFAIDIVDVGWRHWRSYLTDLWVAAEVLVWNGGIQDVVRHAVRRPRPFMYTPGLYASERDTADAAFSFYSGHTAFAFAAATTAAYTFTLRHPHSRAQWIVWPALMLLASTEPVLRVLSGDHFPTDVMVGALAGSAVGLLIPALHRRVGHAASPVVASLRLAPTQTSTTTALTLVGAF